MLIGRRSGVHYFNLVIWFAVRVPVTVRRPAQLVLGCIVLGLGIALLLQARLGADGYTMLVSGIVATSGVAFWIVRPDGNKLGYGPLASYAPGISHGASVRLGAPLGTTTGQLAFAWRRAGVAVDPYPLLVATRPPSSTAPAD